MIEAKKEALGQNITTVEDQTAEYGNAKLKWVQNTGIPLPFLYEATGVLNSEVSFDFAGALLGAIVTAGTTMVLLSGQIVPVGVTVADLPFLLDPPGNTIRQDTMSEKVPIS